MAFDELDSYEEDQKVVISAEDAGSAAGAYVALNQAKFEKVGSVTIFVEENQGGLDSTVINKMEILGNLRVRSLLVISV